METDLEQSKNEAAELREVISECKQQIEANKVLVEQLLTERQTTNELREALSKSEGRESKLTETLEEDAELERFRIEEKRWEEYHELQYYRAIENERKQWEA